MPYLTNIEALRSAGAQGGERKEYVGACRVFGIGDKLIFEQLTQQDHDEMLMCAP